MTSQSCISKSLFLFVFIFLLPSCGDQFVKNKKTILLSAENQKWFVSDEVGDHFVMTDSLGNPEVYNLKIDATGFDVQTRGDGFDKEVTEFEWRQQNYSSDTYSHLSIQMNSVYANNGIILKLYFNRVGFYYNLNTHMLDAVIYPDQINGFELSSINYLDTLVVNNAAYKGVLHFQLEDFKDTWQDTTVVEYFIAKEFGVIKYVLNNGAIFQRVK